MLPGGGEMKCDDGDYDVMGQRIKYYESLKVRLEADAARRRRDEMR